MAPKKFRAWHLKKKTMIPDTGLPHTGYRGEGDLKSMVHMQFTGHLACDGDEIYEGDILEFEWEDTFGSTTHVGYVLWDEIGARWMLECSNEGVDVELAHAMESSENADRSNTVKILGNIHENPDIDF